MIKSLIISLFLTIIIELITSFLLGVKKNTKIIICANICTNPIVVYISNCILIFKNEVLYFSVVILLEILAIIL